MLIIDFLWMCLLFCITSILTTVIINDQLSPKILIARYFSNIMFFILVIISNVIWKNYQPLLELKDIVTIDAIFFGPLIALTLQKYLDYKKDVLKSREEIYKTLLTYRGIGSYNLDVVKALNLVQLEFKEDSEIIRAYEIFHRTLQQTNENSAIDRPNTFKDLIFLIGKYLNYKISREDLNLAYYPDGAEKKELYLSLLIKEQAKIAHTVCNNNKINDIY